jgi:hypothetical protein
MAAGFITAHPPMFGGSMLNLPKEAVDLIWRSFKQGDTYTTPDKLKGVPFTISLIEHDRIHILPQNLSIQRNAFVATVEYLQQNEHTPGKRCEIRSNNDRIKAGPLCQASRKENGNIRCINYIVPILKKFGVVDCDGNQPNTVWLRLKEQI